MSAADIHSGAFRLKARGLTQGQPQFRFRLFLPLGPEGEDQMHSAARRIGNIRGRAIEQLARTGLIVAVILATSIMGMACGAESVEDTPTAENTLVVSDDPREIVIASHDSFRISEDVIAEFEAEHNAIVTILKSGDAGEALTRAILTKDAPTADLLYGIDNSFLGRALDEDIFQPYTSPQLENVPEQYRLDPTGHVMPVDYGFVALNYDVAWMAENGVTPPGDLQALTESRYEGLLAVQNPATSSPGLSFLLATIAAFGETGDYTWRDFWADLIGNDVLVTGGWTEAYYTYFTLYDGDRPIVVSYTTSPAAEVFYSEGAFTEPPTANVLGDNSAFLQIEGIGILRGANNVDLAQAFVDFAMDRRFQEDFPTQMWVYPANSQAVTPDVFGFAPIPDNPATLTPSEIADNRERWIDEWSAIVRG